MKRLAAGLLAGVLAVALGACAGARRNAPAQAQAQTVIPGPTPSPSALAGLDAKAMIADWPQASQQAAQAMLSRYGQPDAISTQSLEWKDKAPFTRIVVTREAVQHAFPYEHPEVLTEEVNLVVPADKLAELARFDGSLIVDRTKGTVAARSDKESSNLLALNLADDIATGRRDAASARQIYAETLQRLMSGKSSPYTEKLQFSVTGRTANPDHPVQAPPAE